VRRVFPAAVAALVVFAGGLLAGGPAGAADGPMPRTDAPVATLAEATRCANAAWRAGWRHDQLTLSVAIALAESGCVADAKGYNPPSEDCPDGSLDRGAWQINDCYWSDVPDSCAYRIGCNASAAYDIYVAAGRSFRWWATYVNGLYVGYLPQAQRAVDRSGHGDGRYYGLVTTGDGSGLNVRAGPGADYELRGTVPDGSLIGIRCQVKGDAVYSEVYGVTTRWWDKIAGEPSGYVTDAYVFTGKDGRATRRC
jgi:hypothetical protein